MNALSLKGELERFMRNSPTLTSSVDNQRYNNQPSFACFGTTRAPNPSDVPQLQIPTSTAPTFYSWLRPLRRQRISLLKTKALIGQLTELSKKLDIKARNSLTYVIIALSPILVSFSDGIASEDEHLHSPLFFAQPAITFSHP